MTERTILVVGGSSGIGLELAKDLIAGGDRVILTSRSQETVDAVVADLGDRASGVVVDISEPEEIADRLAPVGKIDGLVLSAIERDANTIREYDIARARRLITLKLVGYTETIHTLLDRLTPSVDTGIVLFGGRAKDAPYPGSTTVSTINGGVDGIMNTLALELAPIRVNSLHPGIIGDSQRLLGEIDAALGDGARALPELEAALRTTRIADGPTHPRTYLAELALARYRLATGDAAALGRLDALAGLPEREIRTRRVGWLAAAAAAGYRCDTSDATLREHTLAGLRTLRAQVRNAQPEGGMVERVVADTYAACLQS